MYSNKHDQYSIVAHNQKIHYYGQLNIEDCISILNKNSKYSYCKFFPENVQNMCFYTIENKTTQLHDPERPHESIMCFDSFIDYDPVHIFFQSMEDFGLYDLLLEVVIQGVKHLMPSFYDKIMKNKDILGDVDSLLEFIVEHTNSIIVTDKFKILAVQQRQVYLTENKIKKSLLQYYENPNISNSVNDINDILNNEVSPRYDDSLILLNNQFHNYILNHKLYQFYPIIENNYTFAHFNFQFFEGILYPENDYTNMDNQYHYTSGDVVNYDLGQIKGIYYPLVYYIIKHMLDYVYRNNINLTLYDPDTIYSLKIKEWLLLTFVLIVGHTFYDGLHNEYVMIQNQYQLMYSFFPYLDAEPLDDEEINRILTVELQHINKEHFTDFYDTINKIFRGNS